jgi:hypothetical protein
MSRYILAFFLTAAATASAQELSLPDKLALQKNCKQDIQRLCPSIKPGDGGLMACAKQHREEFSPACSATLADLMAKQKQ